jgi:thimet oligopeptidase
VRVIEVIDATTNILRGYVALDLYPRMNKFKHAGACFPILPALKKNNSDQEIITPGLAVVIANMPQATQTKPALLKHDDAVIFFHEFSHAMHILLGTPSLSYFSALSPKSLSAKADFFELPSQMFEEWMHDATTLQQLSSHYQTKQPLDKLTIQKIQALRTFDSGYAMLRLCFLSLLSLELHKVNGEKDINSLCKTLSEKVMPFIRYEPETNYCASFYHLASYGAKVYSYLWSQAFALDVFDTIKKTRLQDQAMGARFVHDILEKGMSHNPSVMLKNFLERKPNQEAFLKSFLY